MKLSRENVKIFIQKNNLVPKVVSIFLAVILWGYIASTKSGEVKFKLPVNYKNLDKSLTVADISDKTVTLKVKGKNEDIKNITAKNFKVYIDLSSASIGEYGLFKAQVEKLELTDDVEIDITPAEIKTLVENKISRNIPIVPRYSGEPGKGYILGKIRLNPEYVMASGAWSKLSKIDFVNTEYIFLNNKSESFSTKVKLEKNGEDVEFSFSEINVTIPIFAKSDIKTVELPLSVKNRIKGFVYTLSPDKVNVSFVEIKGKEAFSDDIIAYIDASEILINSDDLSKNGKIIKEVFVHAKNISMDESSIINILPEKIKVVIVRE